MTERADLARVYRAIGNSQAPMPVDVDIWVNLDHLDLRLPDNSVQAVNVWARALRVKTERGGTTVSGGRTFHSCASVRTEWLGWKVQVESFIDGPSPSDRARTPTAVLGTGDEPADEAIVPMPTRADFNPAYRVARCGQGSAHSAHVMEHGPDQPRNCPGTGEPAVKAIVPDPADCTSAWHCQRDQPTDRCPDCGIDSDGRMPETTKGRV